MMTRLRPCPDPFGPALAQRERLTAKKLAIVDQLRRNNAKERDAPAFPAEWPPPVAKYWVRVFSDDVERLYPIEPTMPHLTIWRFAPEGAAAFEVTAIFGRFCDVAVPTFVHSQPPGEDWEWVGPTTDHSMLWCRSYSPGRAARLLAAAENRLPYEGAGDD